MHIKTNQTELRIKLLNLKTNNGKDKNGIIKIKEWVGVKNRKKEKQYKTYVIDTSQREKYYKEIMFEKIMEKIFKLK